MEYEGADRERDQRDGLHVQLVHPPVLAVADTAAYEERRAQPSIGAQEGDQREANRRRDELLRDQLDARTRAEPRDKPSLHQEVVEAVAAASDDRVDHLHPPLAIRRLKVVHGSLGPSVARADDQLQVGPPAAHDEEIRRHVDQE